MTRFIDVKLGDFELLNVKAPKEWSDRAISIAARTYFTPEEKSVHEMLDRVVKFICSNGYDTNQINEETDKDFYLDLHSILYSQKFAFNTPVWMNAGVENRDPQMWACLIQGVEDDMKSIQDGWIIESETFQGGSGSGVNVSKIRANGEPLSGGGVGSGPISLWMQPTDAIAGVVRSGGRARRAAKMVVMDVDHPDIEEFIECKAKAEKMSKDLQNLGYDIRLNGTDSQFIPFQQANNSVRVTDVFMESLYDEKKWKLIGRVSKEFDKEVSAKEIWYKIAKAAWECGDPGIQFHDTVNEMNPCRNDGEIRATNPCGEYVWFDNTVCNLGSINLMKFVAFNKKGELFVDWTDLRKTVRIAVQAMDILVDASSYPTPKIKETALQYRTIGLGFTNLGALLMSAGIPYDSQEGRDLAAELAGFIHLSALEKSQELAEKLGAYPAYKRNQEHQFNVLLKHLESWQELERQCPNLPQAAFEFYKTFDITAPLRNAQVTVVAPTGTISLLMDCETTGIEPVISLEAYKDLVDGGQLDVGVTSCIEKGLVNLKLKNEFLLSRSDEEIIEMHSRVFQTAIDKNSVSPEGHVLMMAAVQPFVSGGISKTCNLPSEASVNDIANIYYLAWEVGLKAISVYRDGCKTYQPVNGKKEVSKLEAVITVEENPQEVREIIATKRKRPPTTRNGITNKFEIQGQEYYITANRYVNGEICEIFIQGGKHGSEVTGWMNAFSIITSKALQYGVPLDDIISTFRRYNFVPQGLVVSDSNIKFAESPLDYIVRWLDELRQEKPFITTSVMETKSQITVSSSLTNNTKVYTKCTVCDGDMIQSGSCMLCTQCGITTGCG